jgi:hypothetical protein
VNVTQAVEQPGLEISVPESPDKSEDADEGRLRGFSNTKPPEGWCQEPAKESLAERADERERDQIKDHAEDQATAIILDRHRDQWREERDMIIAAVAEPDHALLWEEAPDPTEDD